MALYGCQACLNQNNLQETLKKVCPKPQYPFLASYQVNTVLYESVTPIKYLKCRFNRILTALSDTE